MKKKIVYTDELMDVKIIDDFLPSPSELVFKEEITMTDSVKEAIGSAVQGIVDAGIKVSFTKKELDELGVKVPTVELSSEDIKP